MGRPAYAWYMWVWAHAQDSCLFAVDSCVPLCVDACTGQRAWLTRIVAATPPHNQLAFFPPGDKLLQIDFPCQAQQLRTHPGLDSVRRKQTICSQGAWLGIRVSLQQGQNLALNTEKEGTYSRYLPDVFQSEGKMPVIAKVQGTTTKPFSTNAVWEQVYTQVHFLRYFIPFLLCTDKETPHGFEMTKFISKH